MVTLNFSNLYSQSAEFWLEEGNKKFLNKDYQGAISDYTSAIAINPNYAEAYFNR
ncbi:MAG: tetratricopeptide repeat protein, partial [bacterium]|nr:tetratricopeptide repeat protein [bacterium]